MISDIDYKYFQPVKDGEMPEELFSFQAFRSEQECKDWLWQHDYDADEWDICEFNNDEIEGVTLIDEYGDQYPNIEDLDDNELKQTILEEVAFSNGVLGEVDDKGNCVTKSVSGEGVRKEGESQQDYEDRVHTTAKDWFLAAVTAMEEDNEYCFAKFGGNPETEWYDSVREDCIGIICQWLFNEGEDA